MNDIWAALASREGLMSVLAGLCTLALIALGLSLMSWRYRRANRAAQAVPAAPDRAGESEGQSGGGDATGALRAEIASSVRDMSESVTRAMADIVRAQQVQNDAFKLTIGELQQGGAQDEYERVIAELGQKMDALIAGNNARMEAMLSVVDQKLDSTLEVRFDERFQKVSEQMDQLYRGIEDVRALSDDVCDLKRVLSGAKTGGMLGETQLNMLLTQNLTSEQYEENKRLREDGERVAFVVKLPGREEKSPMSYLPIEAKFSKQTSAQLLYALDGGSAEEIEAAWEAFEAELIEHAAFVAREFLNPPLTTDFAVIFFPSDGLYAQALRRPGMVAKIQDEYHVLLTGPTTLTALLSSLQMGFRTLKIERRSEAVWATLGAVRGEFVNFADALAKTQKRINQASDAIEEAARKSRLIEQKLRGIEAHDGEKRKELFGKPAAVDDFLRELHEDWE
jgi:DNA recombination protein RmuC